MIPPSGLVDNDTSLLEKMQKKSRSAPKNYYSINKRVVIIKILGIILVKLRFEGLRFHLAQPVWEKIF